MDEEATISNHLDQSSVCFIPPNADKNDHDKKLKLDQIVIEYMEALEEYQRLTLKAGDYMKQGFLKLTRAKFNHGLTMLHDTNISPILTLSMENHQDHHINVPNPSLLAANHLIDEQSDIYQQVLYEGVFQYGYANPSIDNAVELQPHTIRRIVFQQDENSRQLSKRDGNPSLHKANSNIPSIAKSKDPLHCFPFLFRNLLKDVQPQFINATITYITMANLVQKINSLEKQFKNCKIQRMMDPPQCFENPTGNENEH